MIIKVHLLEILRNTTDVNEVIGVDEDYTIFNFDSIERIGVQKGLTFTKACKNKVKDLPIFPSNIAKINFEKPSFIKMKRGEIFYALESPYLIYEQLS